MNNYRVVLGYLKKVAEDAITPEKKRELLEQIKEEPDLIYYIYDYLKKGWLKLEDPELKQAILEQSTKDPSYTYEYIDIGWLKPEDPGVKQAVLRHIKNHPFTAGLFRDKGCINRIDLVKVFKEDPLRYLVFFDVEECYSREGTVLLDADGVDRKLLINACWKDMRVFEKALQNSILKKGASDLDGLYEQLLSHRIGMGHRDKDGTWIAPR